MKMTDLSTYEYDKAYVQQTEEMAIQYERKINIMLSDTEVIVEHLNKLQEKLNRAEEHLKLIANTYHLTEAKGYFEEPIK
tara:strand:- start:29468 stop:29707 length:240 start_codon:yes stop_codon:yes gene_type:complete